MKRRPQWDDSTSDRNQYRLTYAEQLQRKASMVSKNKEQAREELIKRQEQLKLGKIPEEIKNTIALSKKPSQKSQKTIKKSSSISADLTKSPISNANSLPNHFVALKKTLKQPLEEHFESLNKLDFAMKELENAMLRAANSDENNFIGKNLEINEKSQGYEKKNENFKEDTISEASLFGISDDEDFTVSKFSEISKVSGKIKGKNNEETGKFQEFFKETNFEAETTKKKEYFEDELKNSQIKSNINFENIENRMIFENFQNKMPNFGAFTKDFTKNDEFVGKYSKQVEGSSELIQDKLVRKNEIINDDQIYYENVWLDIDKNYKISDNLLENDKEKENEMIKLIEQTRKDLNFMEISNEPISVKENFGKIKEFEYDPDVIPQKFNLKPLEKPQIPRTGINSLSIFDHVKNVKIDCRKFIL